jgi:hypothetical protein
LIRIDERIIELEIMNRNSIQYSARIDLDRISDIVNSEQKSGLFEAPMDYRDMIVLQNASRAR